MGAIVTFKYQELSASGKPRFPAFLRIRTDVTWDDVCKEYKKKPEFKQVLNQKVQRTALVVRRADFSCVSSSFRSKPGC